jgi:hypothetical protein
MRLWQLLLSLLFLCFAQADTQPCRQITSPSSIQTVISNGGAQVSVCFDGNNQARCEFLLSTLCDIALLERYIHFYSLVLVYVGCTRVRAVDSCEGVVVNLSGD